MWRSLVDAQHYQAKNPMLTKIVSDKPKLMILNKVDLADPVATKRRMGGVTILWVSALKLGYQLQRAVNSQKVTDAAKRAWFADKNCSSEGTRGFRWLKPFDHDYRESPMPGTTLMNRLTGKKIAVVEINQGDQGNNGWKPIKDLENLDTPGSSGPSLKMEKWPKVKAS